MTLARQPLTNGAFWPRELKPTVLLCVHVTDNMGTAAQQVHYANRAGSGGPSAHDYLDPDGSGIEALDPAAQCAWSNGDVQAPNLAIATVKAAVLAHLNPNRIVWREVECVGDGTHPVTDAQLDEVARLVAADSRATGLPVNRSTVTTHADWNSVTRNSCAFRPSIREARLARVIAAANEILGGADMPGLGVHMAATVDATPLDAFGTARVRGTGHSLIRVRDGVRRAVADGLDLGTVQRAELTAPLDANAGDRTHVVLFNDGGEATVALLSDVAFMPLPAPADASPFTQADMDKATAAGYAAAKANATKAVGGI